ncbi:MAG: hypothetical protein ACFFD4_30000 [Candidatus Odinarchaeota archaeon]
MNYSTPVFMKIREKTTDLWSVDESRKIPGSWQRLKGSHLF